MEAVIPAKSYKSCDSGGSQEIKARSDAEVVVDIFKWYVDGDNEGDLTGLSSCLHRVSVININDNSELCNPTNVQYIICRYN